MQKILRNKKILLCGMLPTLNTEEVDFNLYKAARGLYIEDPWERVKSIFLKGDLGEYHPELINAVQMAQYGGISGMVIGTFIEARKATENFIRTNDASIFYDKREAFKMLNNKNWLAGIKGSFKWGPSFALFFGGFSLISSCCELYRNKIDVLDNTIAGASLGAINRFMFGFKGMLAGALFGSFFGTFYGITFWGLSKLIRKDCLEIKYTQFAYFKHRKEKKMSSEGKINDEDLKIMDSGLHVWHVENPLDMLKDETENNNVKETKETKETKEK